MKGTDNIANTIPVVLRNVDQSGVAKPSAVILLSDYVRTAKFQPQDYLGRIEKALEELLSVCRRALAHKNAKENWITIGREITRFQSFVSELDSNPRLFVANVVQYLSETLKVDPNTINSYLIFYQSTLAISGPRSTRVQDIPTDVTNALAKAGRPLSLTEIAIRTGVNYNTLRRQIVEMYRKGEVKRVGRGLYTKS